MLVSVLITNYNYARYLPAAIDSALGQTYPHVEVIVVDDGSTDESAAVIASYGDRVTAVVQSNGGPAAAFNRAFQLSGGELICILDADDVFEPNKVEVVAAAAQALPDAHLIHHRMQMIDEADTPMDAPFPRHVANGDVRHLVPRAGGWFPHALGSALTFRRSYLERVGPLPARHVVRIGSETHEMPVYPDTYLAGPAAVLGPVVGIRQPLTRYRVHGRNITGGARAADAVVRYESEARALKDVMKKAFAASPAVTLDGHVDYQLRLCAARRISRPRTAVRIMRSPLLPVGLRMRETLRIATNRGFASR
jgi:glycosyltransferase involved in cell wall biosynthesis